MLPRKTTEPFPQPESRTLHREQAAGTYELNSYLPVTLSQIALVSTVASNRAASKKAPLSFLEFDSDNVLTKRREKCVAPIKAVSFPWWWCQSVLQHHRNKGPDLFCNLRPM